MWYRGYRKCIQLRENAFSRVISPLPLLQKYMTAHPCESVLPLIITCIFIIINDIIHSKKALL